MDGEVVHLLEVIGGEVESVLPVPAEPFDVVGDRVDVFLLFFFGVCVVEAEVAGSAELGSDAEVEADAFCVADVEIAVWLRREACGDPAFPFAAFVILDNHLPDKIQPLLAIVLCHCLYPIRILLYLCLSFIILIKIAASI